jgi:hypothetical protein
MSHLPTERLAALVDEQPTTDEVAHLTSCADCARERATFRALADLSSSESTRIGLPLTSWERLAPALVADGVIDDGRGALGRAVVRRSRRPWLQAAAATLLVGGGTMLGRYSAGASVLPVAARTAATAEAPRFASVDEARSAQAQSYSLYQTATAFLAQRDTARMAPDSPGAMRTRLAALDRANAVMGEALNEAPYDPVINNYYLTTQGQREATIRQLNTVMPASMRIQSY